MRLSIWLRWHHARDQHAGAVAEDLKREFTVVGRIVKAAGIQPE